MYRCDKKRPEKGGGVILYVDTRIKSYTDEKCTNVGFAELVWVIAEVRKKSKLLVSLCYRSPGSEEFNNDKLLVRNLITTNYWRSCS
jgi:hypothetical protein